MMQKGRILGLDFGLKRIGFAVSDFEHKLALPIGFVENKGREKVVLELRKICDKYEINKIIIGKPISLNAKQTEILAMVEDFADFLRQRLQINVLFEDERLTSVQAGKYLAAAGMKEKQQRFVRDSVSASIFLQTYLDKLNAKRN
ncbi:Holliday junction resolvase RuvX [Candidatus Peregrinibacteria bacterium]|nr:Holliday junction resolvase RuvX [Candidatus Peregrinibacteria bacterium]